MLNIAICDNEPSICNWIDRIIFDYKTSNKIKFDVETFYSGEALCEFMENEHRFDVIFLDIELEEKSGIDVGREIRKINRDNQTEIIYISGKSQYAKELFDMQPLNFLEKPLTCSAIISNLELAMERLGDDDKYFIFSISGKTYRIKYCDILFLESKMRKIILVTETEHFLFYEKFDRISEILPDYFVQIHRSYIINIHKIKILSSSSVTMEDNTTINIGKIYQDKFREIQKDKLKEKGLLL